MLYHSTSPLPKSFQHDKTHAPTATQILHTEQSPDTPKNYTGSALYTETSQKTVWIIIVYLT